jgi:hypothetical protein
MQSMICAHTESPTLRVLTHCHGNSIRACREKLGAGAMSWQSPRCGWARARAGPMAVAGSADPARAALPGPARPATLPRGAGSRGRAEEPSRVPLCGRAVSQLAPPVQSAGPTGHSALARVTPCRKTAARYARQNSLTGLRSFCILPPQDSLEGTGRVYVTQNVRYSIITPCSILLTQIQANMLLEVLH